MRRRRTDALVRWYDILLKMWHGESPSPSLPARPRRVLLANYGHLGDVVMSTLCIDLLKRAWPDVSLGFLVGRWAQPVLEGHPDLERLHVLDHWFMDRGPPNRLVKAWRYRRAARRMADELRAAKYDAAIDLRAYFPNAIAVLQRAGIPVRIGYTSVGGGPLLTHPVDFVYRRKPESDVQADLLRRLGMPETVFASAAFRLPPVTDAFRAEVEALLASAGWNDGSPFRVAHPCASIAERDWPVEHWRRLIHDLGVEGRRVLLTGRGQHDQSVIHRIMAGLNHCRSACDRLSWGGLVELVRRAELVYSVETATGHVAAAVGTPCVAIYGGMSDARHWAPRPGPRVTCVTNPVPCSPCFAYNGCGHFSCLRGLEASRVHAAGARLSVM